MIFPATLSPFCQSGSRIKGRAAELLVSVGRTNQETAQCRSDHIHPDGITAHGNAHICAAATSGKWDPCGDHGIVSFCIIWDPHSQKGGGGGGGGGGGVAEKSTR